jgi:putative flippase GtrA
LGSSIPLERVKTWAREKRSFFIYIAIGLLTAGVDVGTLAGLLSWHVFRELAVSFSFAAAMFVQFTLNRSLNFRSYDRPLHRQAGTYVAVTAFTWLLTVCLIDLFVLEFGTPVLAAKIMTLPITFPLSFLGHKYLTFGAGLRAAAESLLRNFDKRRGN